VIILNIMHMFDWGRRAPSGNLGVTQPGSTPEHNTQEGHSWFTSFAHLVGLDRLYSQPHQVPPPAEIPSTDKKSVALAFLQEIRPFIERGQLQDLAEHLHAKQKASSSFESAAMNSSAKGDPPLDEAAGLAQAFHTKHQITRQLAQKFLGQMPDWLTEETENFSDVAQCYAAEWAPYFKGSAPLDGGIRRLGAVASLIDAYMIDEFPTGLRIVEAAHVADIPAVLATRHHTRGGWAVPGLAELLKRSGVLNGVIASQDPSTRCPAEDADIFWERSKESPEIWAHCFERLLKKGLNPDSSIILVVDDNLSSRVKDCVREAFHSTISKAAEQNSSTTHGYVLAFCGSIVPALNAIQHGKHGKIAGVVSDLFSPAPQTEGVRQKFRSYFKETCAVLGVPPEANVDNLLDRLDADKSAARESVVRFYRRVLKACIDKSEDTSQNSSNPPAREA
jgi:hypothetical protein